MEAYAIRNADGSKKLDAESNDSPFRKEKDEATGVMIHVGGEYTNSSGENRITGSEGCFTLAGPDSGNKGIKKFINDVVKRQLINKKAAKGTSIDVDIEKRKKVNVKWKVDSNGNKVE
jgi:hypothetical protein